MTAAYIPDLAHQPLRRRRAWLERERGFRCTCPRCRAEEALPAAFHEAAEAAAAAAQPDPPGPLIQSIL